MAPEVKTPVGGHGGTSATRRGNRGAGPIAQVVTRLNVGGVSDQVLTIARGLIARGEPVVLVVGRGTSAEGDLGPAAEAAGIPLVRVAWLSNGSGPFGDVLAIAELYRTLRRYRPSLVHAHMFKARVLGGVAAALLRVPLVQTLHGNVLRGYYGRLRARIILAAERLVGRRLSKVIIVPSERQLADVREFGIAPREKVLIHRYGLDLSRFLRVDSYSGQLKTELGIPSAAVVCAVVSRLVPIKGLSYFLGAMAEVAKRSTLPVYALIVGDGELRVELEAECARSDIADRCRFLGWRKDLDRIYGDVDIAVLSSLNEGTPVSVIEAMAAGRAIVATAVGGIPDMLEDGHSGILVPPRDVSALADAILRLASDAGARCRLGTEARRRALADYSVETLIAETLDVYSGLRRPEPAGEPAVGQGQGRARP